ncbi:MAG TPA: hypothetical protein VNZ52_00790 [Candidatus Thermoplasmatota archaeon]|nr:hypothetical protein [Candidatus Thermoplasmatota archaeon]
MSGTILLDLQKRQVVHDREYHRDIFFLPYPQRMTHFALHFAKYVGRLAAGPISHAELEKTLADCVIVSLAASDVLHIDFDSEIKRRLGAKTLTEAESLAAESIGFPSDRGEAQREWALRLAVPTGRIGKALESLDHMESLNVREVLASALVEIVLLNLAVARLMGLHTSELVTARWAEIEGRRLL